MAKKVSHSIDICEKDSCICFCFKTNSVFVLDIEIQYKNHSAKNILIPSHILEEQHE